jgi:hypothetical protein
MGARPRRLIVGLLTTILTLTAIAVPVTARDENHPAVDGAKLLRSREPKPLVEPVAPGTVGVPSEVGYFDDTGDPDIAWVVGEVWNRTSARRELIEITITFFDENDVNQGSQSDFVFLERLAPGMRSPFVVVFEADLGDVINTDWSYLLTLDASDTTTIQPVGGLAVTQGTTSDDGSFVTYTGTVHNPNAFAVDFADANVTLYDAAGNVIDAWWSYTTPDTLSPNGNGTYEVEFFIPDGGLSVIDRVTVVSQGWRADNGYVTSWENYFDDIANTSFRNDIIWLARSGITAGCAAGKYCPDAEVKRDQMASFLSRALGLTGTPPNAFTDDNGNTHELQINRLFAAGVTSGCGPGLYCPTAPVARDQMASFLSRALGLTGTPPDAFSDDNGNTHELQINRLFAAGITTGCGPTTYCPKQNVTRGQMAAFLKRAFD